MEPGYYLTGLVFAVAALHLISRGVSLFRRTFKSSDSRLTRESTKRSDWYMFFHCSALTGESKKKAADNGTSKDLRTNRGRSKVKDSRPSLRSNLA